METIAALKEVLHHENNERKHPSEQGFAAPLVMGIFSYVGAMFFVLACAAVFTAIA